MRGLIVIMDGVEVMRVNKSLADFSRKNGISLQESHAIYLTKKMNGVLLSDDKRTRQVAKVHGVPAAPSVSLLVLGRDIGVLDEQTFKSLLGRLGSIPLQIPRTLLG
jgi:predicted nucleic acid-binding protein